MAQGLDIADEKRSADTVQRRDSRTGGAHATQHFVPECHYSHLLQHNFCHESLANPTCKRDRDAAKQTAFTDAVTSWVCSTGRIKTGARKTKGSTLSFTPWHQECVNLSSEKQHNRSRKSISRAQKGFAFQAVLEALVGAVVSSWEQDQVLACSARAPGSREERRLLSSQEPLPKVHFKPKWKQCVGESRSPRWARCSCDSNFRLQISEGCNERSCDEPHKVSWPQAEVKHHSGWPSNLGSCFHLTRSKKPSIVGDLLIKLVWYHQSLLQLLTRELDE